MNFSLFLFCTNLVTAYGTCPTVTTLEKFNLSEYVRDRWYIQKQQVTSYLPKSTNYCVSARYQVSNKSVPFYSGIVLDVYNEARIDSANGQQLNRNNMTLCARVPNSSHPSKLLVAPCFLPNLLAGDYWVLDAGPSSDNYEWAIVSGGQPHDQYCDGCTTRRDSMNNAGLWLFTRKQVVPDSLINMMLKKLKEKGFTTVFLNDVTQDYCVY